MTNNPTIDGVSRELRELLERVATEANHMLGFTYASNYDECRKAVDQLRALLDATVVERQPVDFSWTPENNEFYSELSSGGKLAKRALCHIRHLKDGLNKHWKVVCDQRTELATLQSTIAQLQAEKELMLRGAEVYKERIAELDSGRGEPVAWMRTDIPGMCIAAEVKSHNLKIGGAPAKGVEGYNIPLFTAPPAPVAVVLPTTEQFKDAFRATGYVTHDQAWELAEAAEACLDATAALNEVKK